MDPIVIDPTADRPTEHAVIADPRPLANELVVAVQQAAVNHGEVRFLDRRPGLQPYSLFHVGEPITIAAYGDLSPAARDLATLAHLVDAGRLRSEAAWLGSWLQVHEAAAPMTDHRLSAKALLDVGI
jgi:hypothetical protein